MQKPRGASAKKTKTSTLCIPRIMRGSSNKNNRLSPMTLLERFREAVFRLIMLSALSKASQQTGRRSSPPDAVPRKYYYSPADAHHSEAVADCIEFIKKKAFSEEDDKNRDSSVSDDSPSNIDAAAAEMGRPVPVM